ncbi:MAG: 30S ribosomal protein S20, partial [Candidatus Dormibacteraceae bacterium]
MANTRSAKKEAKRSALRAVRNRSIRSAVKTKVTKFRREVGSNLENATEFVQTAVSALDRAVSKGILHRNNAARRKSRLLSQLAKAAAEPIV